jgi:hypothetical protein
LAGLKFRGQIHLRQALPLSALTQCLCKPNFQFDVRGLLFGEAEKILGSADLPSLRFQTFFSFLYALSYSLILRLQRLFMGERFL